MRNTFIFIAGISGMLTVAFGAMGAHALKAVITPEYLQVYEKAVLYQLFHTLGLLVIGILVQTNPSRYLRWSGNFFIAGVVLFSGSLYFLATKSLIGIEGMRWIGAITPLGGISFIAGWLLLAVSFINKKS